MAPQDDTITVTTATQTEAEVRSSLGLPAAEPEVPSKEPAAAEAVAITPEVEADSPKPDAEVSEAARKLRGNRISERRSRLQADNQLYEDTVRRLGGAVEPFVAREYANPQAEIDALSRRRNLLLAETNRLLRIAPPNVPAQPKQPATEQPAADAAPKFTFPSFEQYIVEHPDESHEQYMDARTDARMAWNREQEAARFQKTQAEQAKTAAQQKYQKAFAEHQDHTEKYRADHPDYDAKLTGVTFNCDPNLATDIHGLILDAGAAGPAILDYLADHRADLDRLLAVQNPQQLLRTFGAIEAKATSQTAAPAAPAQEPPAPRPVAAAPAAKPVTDAPAPVEAVRGGAQTTRSLQSLADDSEDADAYIKERQRQRKAG